MIRLSIKEKEISITEKEDLIRGTVGAKCEIIFESFWDKYYKNIIFKRVSNGCATPYRVLIDNSVSEIEIPYEVLAESGAFIIGAYGTTENEVLPTLWSEEIKVLYGTTTNGENAEKYTPSEIEQLRMSKQDKLTAGNGIEIEDNVISAIGGGGGGTADFQLFANALKGTLEGDYLSTNDVSPLEHNLDINLESKNMFSVGAVGDYQVYYTTINVSENNTISGKVIESAIAHCYKLTNYMSGKYTISYSVVAEKPNVIIRCFDESGNIIDNSSLSLSGIYNNFYLGWIVMTSDNNLLTLTIPETVAYWQIGFSFTGTTNGICALSQISIEKGETEGIYANPVIDFSTVAVTVSDNVNSQTVNADIDGTVKGLKSYSPYMVISTDNPNVLINCTYNRDINKVSGNVDLSNYYTKTEIDNKFDEIETAFSDIETLLGGI